MLLLAPGHFCGGSICPPVGDHQAFKLPSISQNLLKQECQSKGGLISVYLSSSVTRIETVKNFLVMIDD